MTATVIDFERARQSRLPVEEDGMPPGPYDFWYPLLEKMSAAERKTTIAEAFRYGVISERDAEIFNTSWPDQEGT